MSCPDAMTQLSAKGAMALKIPAVALAPPFAYVAAVAVGHFRVAVTTTFELLIAKQIVRLKEYDPS